MGDLNLFDGEATLVIDRYEYILYIEIAHAYQGWQVTFIANGGAVSPTTARTGVDGRLQTLPQPTRSGSYTFDGWFTHETAGTRITLDTVFSNDTTVYAQWTSVDGSPKGGVLSDSVSTGTIEQEIQENEVPLEELWVNPFKDVNDTDWFFGAVQYINQKGLIQGTASDTFSPNIPLTRGMAVTVLYRLEGSPSVDGLDNPFSDVPADQWYTNAVIWAAENNIVAGYGGNRYGPADNVTREQLATIFMNYYKHLGKGPEGAWMVKVDFEDLADISDWAFEAVAYCSMTGIITGKPNSIFDPKGNATRAEFATILMRFIEAGEQRD